MNSATNLLYAATDSGPGRLGPVLVFHWISIGAYFFLAARTVHQESRARTAAKRVVFVVGAQLAMGMVPLLAGMGAGTAGAVSAASRGLTR